MKDNKIRFVFSLLGYMSVFYNEKLIIDSPHIMIHIAVPDLLEGLISLSDKHSNFCNFMDIESIFGFKLNKSRDYIVITTKDRNKFKVTMNSLVISVWNATIDFKKSTQLLDNDPLYSDLDYLMVKFKTHFKDIIQDT